MKTLTEIINGNGGNYVAPFLWLHNEDDSLIIKELHRIRDCGIGAVCIESRTHEEFCRDDWWSDVRLILDTCKELGMKLWILDDKHFPSGYANGIFETKYRHLQPKNIRARYVAFAGPVRCGSLLADEWKELPDDEIIGAVAMRRLPDGQGYDGTVVDISSSYKNGRFYFDLPEGIWSVAIIIVSQADISPQFRAFCDKLNPEATAAYIKEVYEPHYERFGADFGDTLLGFFSDEPAFHNNNNIECGTGEPFAGYPWHSNVYERLRELWGDDTLVKLCRLWYDFADGSHESVRETYMDVITALYRDAFSGQIGKWCEEHGVMYIGHVVEDVGSHKKSGKGAGHYFRALEGQHMSGVDVVLQQLIPGLTETTNTGSVSYKEMDNKLNHYILGKLASSAAHIEPKKQGRAMCEIFGAFGWAEDTEFMKFLADHFLVRGINYFVPHAFSPKDNDTDCPPNFCNSGKNPQFKYFGMLMEYLNRMSALTQDAVHVPTCAVIYDAEVSWATRDHLDNKDICKALYDAQLDYDLVPFDRLDDISEEGIINGEYYPVIILPYSAYISKENLRRLERLKKRIVCVCNGTVGGFEHVTLDGLVSYMEQYRDITLEGGMKFLRYAHYDRSGEQCYMLSNEDITPVTTVMTVRGFTGGDYVLWDAFENKAVRRYSNDGKIPITVEPNNLLVLFINCDLDVDCDKLICAPVPLTEELTPEWKIEICREQELPDYKLYKTAKKLINITGPDELPDFTGNMRYTAKISLDAQKHKFIDLGCVGQTAEVSLNGKYVGARIFAPYRFDISEAVIDGENEIEITVANTCTFEQRDQFSKFMLIKPSGLLGPVRV
ncbi:MAG: hypothetical protein IJ428_01045 [Clostridia bacterium]|nr:hypothetical protein [Clostridia bacterium]